MCWQFHGSICRSKSVSLVFGKQGSYGVSVKIDAGDAAKKTVLPDEVPEVDLSTKYVPEGMSWIDEYHLQYPEHDMTGGFSFHLSCWIKMIWDR